MSEQNFISITVNYRKIELDIRTIQYVFVNQNTAEFHISGGECYKTRLPISKLESILGEEFIRINRNHLVAVKAIHDISDKVYLNSGETLNFNLRRKKELSAELRCKRQSIFGKIAAENSTQTYEEYHARFAVFDTLPIAFCDIEMVLDNDNNAVDWIFRYGNEALAKLEKTPLNMLIGRTFSGVFPNMDEKWLKSYERAALYGQTLEIIDFSPEIDTFLNIICFPTMRGHCGCILLDFEKMEYAENRDDRSNAKMHYFAKLLERII